MAYTGKTNWQINDIVMPGDMNRIEQGVIDAHENLLTHNADEGAHKPAFCSAVQGSCNGGYSTYAEPGSPNVIPEHRRRARRSACRIHAAST